MSTKNLVEVEEEADRHLSGEQRIHLRQLAAEADKADKADEADEANEAERAEQAEQASRTRQSDKFRIPDEARRSTAPPGKATARVEIPASIKELSIPTPGRAMDVADVAAMIERGMAEQEAQLTKMPIIIVVPAAPRVPTVEVKEPPPQTILATVKVGRRRFSPLLIKLREVASAFLLFVALLAISLAILRAIVAVLFR